MIREFLQLPVAQQIDIAILATALLVFIYMILYVHVFGSEAF